MTATTDGSTGAVDPSAASASNPTTESTIAADDVLAAARRAAERSVEHLLGRQDEQGWWKGDLATNVTMDAEDLLLRQFLGIQDPATVQAAGHFIRGEQLGDGTWATFHGGPGDLSATIEAYVALRLAGDRPDEPHMARAAVGQGTGRDRGEPRVHPDLAGPLRLVEVGRPAGTPARAHVLSQVGPAQHLRLRLLGPPDHRAPHRRLREAAGTARTLRPGRAAHRSRRTEPAPPPRPGRQLGRRLPAPRQGAAPLSPDRPTQTAQGRHERGRPLDHRTPGERRLLGRHPAARRVLRHRSASARLRPRPPRDAGRARVARPVRGLARGRRPHDRGLSVAGLGHLPRHHRARRRRDRRRPPRAGEGGGLDARRGDRATG